MQEVVKSPPVSLKGQDGASSMPQQQHNGQLRRHSETIKDASHTSLASSTAGSNSIHPLPPPAKGSDSYRPTSSSPGTSPPNKRKRTSKSPVPNQDKPPGRTPICGTCVAHCTPYSCDGAMLCVRCDAIGNRMCVYHNCIDGEECRRRKTCNYLHPDQSDRVAEKDRRLVQELGAKKGEFTRNKS